MTSDATKYLDGIIVIHRFDVSLLYIFEFSMLAGRFLVRLLDILIL